MWRPAHGATNRPGPSRPASGYGRALGRPGPQSGNPSAEPIEVLDPAAFAELVHVDVVDALLDAEVEAAAPVTR